MNAREGIEKGIRIPVPDNARSALNQIASFYENHAEVISFLYNEEGERESFFADMTADKFQECFADPFQFSDDQKQCLAFIPKTEADRKKKLDRVYESFSLGDLVILCEYYRDELNLSIGIMPLEEVQFLAKRTKEHLSPVDKISKAAFDGKFNNGLQTPVVVSPSRKKKIETLVQIDQTKIDKTKIKGAEGLDLYDGEVETAIANLGLCGNQIITPNMIHYEMTRTERITKNQADEIKSSVLKQLKTWISIDAKEEYKAYQKLESAIIEGYAIQADLGEFVLNGQKVWAIQLHSIPLLFRYALQKNQIERVSPKLLNAPVNKNREQIVLAAYLRRRIHDIKGGTTARILYSSIYEALKINLSDPKSLAEKTHKVRTATKKLLDYYKEQGFISDYEIIPRKGIDITLV